MRTRIAGFVLLLTALAGVAFALSQRPHTIQARFPSGAGLAEGAPVRAQGVVVGKLARLTVEPAGTVLAELALESGALEMVPDDSVVLLAPGGIDLLLGDATTAAGPGTILRGYRTLTELRLDSARGSLDKLLEQLQADAEHLGKALQEKGAAAGDVLRRELESLRQKLEKTFPPRKGKGDGAQSI